MVITHLPLEFSGARDMAEGSTAESGSGASAMLSGIMTQSKDRGLSGVPAFLTFTLDRPAVVSLLIPLPLLPAPGIPEIRVVRVNVLAFLW